MNWWNVKQKLLSHGIKTVTRKYHKEHEVIHTSRLNNKTKNYQLIASLHNNKTQSYTHIKSSYKVALCENKYSV